MAISLSQEGTTYKGAYHFSANKEQFEIQRGNNFDLLITDLDGITEWGGVEQFTNAEDYIRLSVLSTSVPHFSQNPIEIKRGNTSVKYAGVISYGSGSLRVYDFIDIRVKDILMAWQALSGDPRTQKVGLQKDYKKKCYLMEYTPDYSRIVRTWELDGCWISSMSEDDYSQDANNARTTSITLEYDRAWPVVE